MKRLTSVSSGELALRGAFVVALVWALVVLAAPVGDAVLADAFGADAAIRRHAGVVLLLLALPVGLLASVAALRRWPGFLRVGHEPGWPGVLLRMLAWAPAVAGVLGAAFFAIQRAFVRVAEDPAHAQYGLSAWAAGLFYALALTPVATVVWTWLRLRRRFGEAA